MTDRSIYTEQFQTKIAYGYEFIGVPQKMVFSNISDRMWMSVTQAIQGQAPIRGYGGEGAGKSESLKDLGNYLGKFTYFFNCQGQLNNINLLLKLVNGACSTGAWFVFDQFQDVSLEIMSLLSQQIMVVKEGLRKLDLQQHKNKNI